MVGGNGGRMGQTFKAILLYFKWYYSLFGSSMELPAESRLNENKSKSESNLGCGFPISILPVLLRGWTDIKGCPRGNDTENTSIDLSDIR